MLRTIPPHFAILFLAILYLGACLQFAIVALRWNRAHPLGADAHGELSARGLFLGLLALVILVVSFLAGLLDRPLSYSPSSLVDWIWNQPPFPFSKVVDWLLLSLGLLPLAGAIPAIGKKAILVALLSIAAFLGMSVFTISRLLEIRMW